LAAQRKQFGHLKIIRRRRRITGRMLMNGDDGSGMCQQCAGEDLTRFDDR
jgi:hypothetical protein